MSQRRTRRQDEFWNDQPGWDETKDTPRTRSHRQITRSNRIIPGFGANDPTPVSPPRMFDYESDDPDYSTGTVRPASAAVPTGGYAWEVTSTDDFGIDDDDDGWDTTHDDSGQFGLGTYSGLADGDRAAPIDDEDDAPDVGLADRPQRVGIDPLLMRLGVIIAIAVMAIPIAMGLSGGESSAEGSAEIEPADSEAEQTSTSAVGPDDGERATTQTRAKAKAKMKAKTEERKTTSATAAATVSGNADADESGDSGDSGSSASAEPTVACGQEYEVVQGDYWTRVSDASGAHLDDLLAANSATVDTPLYPGAVICLSQGAIRQPVPPTTTSTAPPTTQAPTTTEAPATTEAPTTTKATAAATTAAPTTTAPTTAPPTTTAPSTAAPTTAAPTTTAPSTAAATTAPPTTRQPVPPPPARSGSVEDIIRSVWPDHLEQRAIVIASRESSLIPTAENYCCVGLFQIYYDVHRDWLGGVGVHQESDLYDPYLNAKAAYTLYQRSGGWGPWSQTNY